MLRCTCAAVNAWRSEDSLPASLLSSRYVASKALVQVARLGLMRLYPLSRFTSPQSYFLRQEKLNAELINSARLGGQQARGSLCLLPQHCCDRYSNASLHSFTWVL